MYKLFVSALLLATILVKAEARAQMAPGGGPPGGAPPAGFPGPAGAPPAGFPGPAGGFGGQAGGGFQVSGPGGTGFGASTGTSAGAGAGALLPSGGIAGLVNANKKASCGRSSTAAPATSAAPA